MKKGDILATSKKQGNKIIVELDEIVDVKGGKAKTKKGKDFDGASQQPDGKTARILGKTAIQRLSKFSKNLYKIEGDPEILKRLGIVQ